MSGEKRKEAPASGDEKQPASKSFIIKDGVIERRERPQYSSEKAPPAADAPSTLLKDAKLTNFVLKDGALQRRDSEQAAPSDGASKDAVATDEEAPRGHEHNRASSGGSAAERAPRRGGGDDERQHQHHSSSTSSSSRPYATLAAPLMSRNSPRPFVNARGEVAVLVRNVNSGGDLPALLERRLLDFILRNTNNAAAQKVTLSVPDSRNHWGHAIVVVKGVDDAERVVRALHRQDFEGSALTADFALLDRARFAQFGR